MLTAFFKKGTNILIGNWLKQFREKNKRTIFVVTKLTYLVWTASLAGALDKWKSNIVDDYGDHLFIYIVFWLLLAGVGLLFSLFWKAKNREDFECILHGLQGGVVLPMVLVYVVLFVSLSMISANHDIAGTIIFTSIPVTVGVVMAVYSSINKSGLLSFLRKAFELR